MRKPHNNLPEINFLRTELLTGLTLSKIALGATDERKRARNQAKARTAYQAVLRFLPGTYLESDEADEIKSKLEQLKSDLQLLGEEI